MKYLILPAVAALLLTGCDLPHSFAKAAEKGTNTPPEAVASADTTASTNAPASVPLPNLPPDLPEAARDVINLAHTQVGDGILTNYIANFSEPFHLDADQIVYLRDVGLSPEVIEALLLKEQQLTKATDGTMPTVAQAGKPAGDTNAPVPAPVVANTPTVYPGGQAEMAPPHVDPAVATGAPADSGPPPAEVNNNYFYSSLAPYGNWITVPSYGYVWQPSCAVVSPGWRPYWNCGNWTWSNAGWYWNSSYSWGWAPFHYGNWVNASCGWCWVPGNCWAPSWVTFRYGGGNCGWAPLPPGCGWSSGVGLTWAGAGVGVGFGFSFGAANYCWVPATHFTAANCWQHGIYGTQVNQIYQHSTVINNYVVGNNNTIINKGIDPAHISQYTRSEIRKVQLTDVANPAGASGLTATTARPGQTGALPVYRPSIPANALPAKSGAPIRSEARPNMIASANSPASDRGRLPGRPATTQPDVMPAPAATRSPLGSAVNLHSSPQLGRGGQPGVSTPSSSASVGSIANRPGPTSNARPIPANRFTGGPNQPLAYRGNAGNYAAPANQVNSPYNRLEPRKLPPSPINPGNPAVSYPGGVNPRTGVGPQPGSYQRPGYATRPAQNYQQMAPARGEPAAAASVPAYQNPGYSRPQGVPAVSQAVPRYQSGNGNASRGNYNYNGGGSSGGSVSRPGRHAP